jgi:hypothetical protein
MGSFERATDRSTPRPYGWRVADWAVALADSDVARQKRQASEAEGKRLRSVRYLNVDYEALGRQLGETGMRLIVDDAEWSSPTWQAVDCDSVDWGIELHLDDESILSFSWQHPEPGTESLVLFSGEVLSGFSGPTSAAVWDVGLRSRWIPLVLVSYDLAVWDGPLPTNDNEAAATYRSLVTKWLEGEGLVPEKDDPTPTPAILRIRRGSARSVAG